jgi:hypothetical protein
LEVVARESRRRCRLATRVGGLTANLVKDQLLRACPLKTA